MREGFANESIVERRRVAAESDISGVQLRDELGFRLGRRGNGCVPNAENVELAAVQRSTRSRPFETKAISISRTLPRGPDQCGLAVRTA